MLVKACSYHSDLEQVVSTSNTLIWNMFIYVCKPKHVVDTSKYHNIYVVPILALVGYNQVGSLRV